MKEVKNSNTYYDWVSTIYNTRVIDGSHISKKEIMFFFLCEVRSIELYLVLISLVTRNRIELDRLSLD